MYFNLIFVVIIVVALMFYLYNKTKQLRTPAALEIRHKWYKAKANVCLGIFILTFGINQFVLFADAITYIVGGIFIVLGAFVAYENVKRAKHYGAFIAEERQLYEQAQQS